jgi:hypothetical protein
MKPRKILFLAVFLFSSTQLMAQTPAPITLLKVGRLLDPHTGNVLAPAAIPIEGDKITQVGSPSKLSVPSGANNY